MIKSLLLAFCSSEGSGSVKGGGGGNAREIRIRKTKKKAKREEDSDEETTHTSQSMKTDVLVLTDTQQIRTNNNQHCFLSLLVNDLLFISTAVLLYSYLFIFVLFNLLKMYTYSIKSGYIDI